MRRKGEYRVRERRTRPPRGRRFAETPCSTARSDDRRKTLQVTPGWRRASAVSAICLALAACAAPRPTSTQPAPGPAPTTGRRVQFEIDYAVRVGRNTDRIVLTTLLPRTRPGRQFVHRVTADPTPDRIWDEQNNRYAEFRFTRPRADFHVRIRCDLTIQRSDLRTARARQLAPEEQPNLRRYLAQERFVEVDDFRIRNLAHQLAAESGSETETVRRLHAGVLRELTVDNYRPQDVGARRTLDLGTGDCTDYMDLFVALCRARGIPARGVEGYTLPFSSVPQHDWAEVWLATHGWTTFDPFRAEWNGEGFERLENAYIWLSTVRNDRVLDGHHYYGYRFWGDPVRVTRSFRAVPRARPVLAPPHP